LQAGNHGDRTVGRQNRFHYRGTARHAQVALNYFASGDGLSWK
jgi:hypothetical protein